MAESVDWGKVAKLSRCVSSGLDIAQLQLSVVPDPRIDLRGLFLMRAKLGDIHSLLDVLHLLPLTEGREVEELVTEIRKAVAAVVAAAPEAWLDDAAVALAMLAHAEKMLTVEQKADPHWISLWAQVTTMPHDDPNRAALCLARLWDSGADKEDPLTKLRPQISKRWPVIPGKTTMHPSSFIPPVHNQFKSDQLGPKKGGACEEAVFHALRDASLPEGLLVIHGLRHTGLYSRWRKGKPAGHELLQRGEADFLVLSPQRGLFVIECKAAYASNILDTAVDQAHNCEDALHQFFKAMAGEEFKQAYGAAEMYPIGSAYLFGSPRPGGWSPGMSVQPFQVGFAEDINRMSEWLEQLFTSTGYANLVAEGDTVLQQGNTSVFELMRGALLADRCSFSPCSLPAELEALEGSIHTWTLDQHKILGQQAHNRRLWIPGVAGSGKTALAMEMFRRLRKAAPQQRTTILVYNAGVANWINHELADQAAQSLSEFRNAQGAVLTSLNEQTRVCPEGTRHGVRLPGEEEVYNVWTLESAARDAQKLSEIEKYHHIIVDEAQDMPPGWLALVEALMVRPREGYSWFFFDDSQSLYSENSSLTVPPGEPWCPLRECVRCSKSIFWQFAELYVPPFQDQPLLADLGGEKVLPMPPKHSFAGPPVDFLKMRTSPDIWPEVAAEAADVVRSWEMQGILRGDIAVLCANWQMAQALSRHFERTEGFTEATVQPRSHFGSGRLCIGSFVQFKGLERQAVLVIGPCSTQELYVASSRARAKLAYLDSDPNSLVQKRYLEECSGDLAKVEAEVHSADAEKCSHADRYSVGQEVEALCCASFRRPTAKSSKSYGEKIFTRRYYEKALTEAKVAKAKEMSEACIEESTASPAVASLSRVEKDQVKAALHAQWLNLPDAEVEEYRDVQWAEDNPKAGPRSRLEWRRAHVEGSLNSSGWKRPVRVLDPPGGILLLSDFEIRPISMTEF